LETTEESECASKEAELDNVWNAKVKAGR